MDFIDKAMLHLETNRKEKINQDEASEYLTLKSH